MKNSANSVSLGVALGMLCGLIAATDASATLFELENPAPGSYQSGVAVLSGWACSAEDVSIELRGTATTEVVEAYYGTPRDDTAIPSACGTGNANTGFGVTTLLNRLGRGPATAILRINGEEVASREFNVEPPTDAEFALDLSGQYLLPGFPGSGQAVTLIWQESLQKFAIAPAEVPPTPSAPPLPACPPGFSTKCTLENPGNGQFMSGIVVFSGWACDADEVRIEVEGQSGVRETIIASYGTARGDTAGADLCGAGDTDNGFGALTNVNRLGTGEATATLWIDDRLATTATFQVTVPSSSEFIGSLSAEYRLPGFPPDKDSIVVWQTADQNFSIKEVLPNTLGPTPTPGPGSTPAPGPTPTPGSEPNGPTPAPSPTPTPNGAVCGNGIVEEGEQCDGADLGEYPTCADLYWGGYGPDGEEACASNVLSCSSDCTYDGSRCSCGCLEDADCYLPEGYFYDCGPSYCNRDYCSEELLEDCTCVVGDHPDSWVDGACLFSNFDNETYGSCMTTPFDPGEFDVNVQELCEGFDGGDPFWPRCDHCD